MFSDISCRFMCRQIRELVRTGVTRLMIRFIAVTELMILYFMDRLILRGIVEIR